MEAPPGLFEDDEAPSDCIAALTAIAPASLRLWKIDPDGAPDLSALMARLCDGAVREVAAIGEEHVWPGLAADVAGDIRETHYLFEHDGAVIYGVARAPRVLWPDYGPFLEMAMLSLDIGARPSLYLPLVAGAGTPELTPKPEVESPSASLERRLASVTSKAQRLIAELDIENAEALVRAIDADIYGASALMQIYEAALAQAPANARIYERALYWARAALPEPHTEVEAEQNEAAITEREAALNRIYRGD
ncbi:hypothetical protein [Vitreimonas flagellata]|uniref:hypothetical protein n=1 Tax=Vitreimonas flagellata TaxID=2560861 RepID=UPI001430A240|nr:hypothetical protein [Vitreimonas flagellata]